MNAPLPLKAPLPTGLSPLAYRLALPFRRLTTFTSLFLVTSIVLGLFCRAAIAADRPNILWITSEDNSPYLGCYGDPLAHTPHLDRLAEQGIRYRRAFANAPVCSTARSTLITGMYATSLGVQHHRSRVAIPPDFKLYPEHLRAAGYYCTNNAKTDYNVANAGQPWDESSNRAHYKNRAGDQPFFAVFNLMTSHESQVAPKGNKTSFRVSPDKFALPPFHPDTPEIRRDWANYYDQMTAMDAQVGQLLSELEQAGLADDTIVFYYGDHGGALPRGKRNIHDSGTRVPLIVRMPKKWEQFAPVKPGEWVDQPVSFVDLPATVFSLCGVPVPEHYQGRAFLGERKGPPREHVFLYRDRMDERYDMARAVRDMRYRYVRNYSPNRPWGQHYSYPFQVQPSMRSWFAEYQAGRCNEVQAAYWLPKPSEELYDIDADPFEIRNLADDPEQAERLTAMRRVLRDELIATRDVGFIPESMFARLAGNGTIYDYAQSDAYPMEQLVDLADKATSRDAAVLPDLLAALDDPHPLVRYWAAVGCTLLRDAAAPAKQKLTTALCDAWPAVRIAAVEALGQLGETDVALPVLAQSLASQDLYELLAALNTLEYVWKAGLVSLEDAQALVRNLKPGEPADRIPKYLLSLAPTAGFYLGQGTLVGEVTPDSAILQARLTASPGLIDGDVPGREGVNRFEIATDASFEKARHTPWMAAASERDFILKAAVDQLEPDTQYVYRAVYGPSATQTVTGPVCRFRTLPAADAVAPVNFILTSCMNYAFFQDGPRGKGGYRGEDRYLGYPALDAVLGLRPDFCIFNGDCVYYDHPVATRAKTQAELRRKWHEQHVQGRFVNLFASLPTYWLKDDHDHRRNDSDTTGDYAPSNELGIATFREQVPVVDPSDSGAETYRTHRIGRDLQLWFVEGRDFRSPNAMPDGPKKTIWGAEQKAWLQRTLTESDATYKILVSPTPMIGPDDASKRDNHVNERGFREEGEAFFAWLKESGIAAGQFYVICGDRHWKYHSTHPSGYEEFCCGALNGENSRLGRAPGDPNSTDPRALVHQHYTDNPPSGGFLRIAVGSADDATASIEFIHHDPSGKVMYRHTHRTP